MVLPKPTGEYVEQMLDLGGWPDVDEDSFHSRAEKFTQVLGQVTAVLEGCLHQRGELFKGGIWSGHAAAAANGELQTRIDGLVTLQNGLAAVAAWHKYIAGSIAQAKSDISDNVDAANRQIVSLSEDLSLEDSERASAIAKVVGTTRGANVSLVDGTAEQIRASQAQKPASVDLLRAPDPKPPAPVPLPDTPTDPPSPGDDDQHRRPPKPTPVSPVTPASPGSPGSPGSPMSPIVPPVPPVRPPLSPPDPTVGPTPNPAPNPAVPPAPPAPRPGGTTPTKPGPAAPHPGAPATPQKPASPAQPSSGDKVGRGVVPASIASAASPSKAPSDDPSAAGAAGMPAAPMSPGAASRAAPRSGRGGAGSAAPVTREPSGTHPGKRPAAARRPARPAGAARDESPRITEAEEVAAAPIPVSAARAERDAIADAATTDASRRRDGTDPLQLARRIAAALNAPGGGGQGGMGFFWLTALTTDGTILVANSYALAYIPAGVQLPEQVRLVSADEAVPMAERARWATYPVLALQGWAAHHEKQLRAVIGTAEQLAGSDSGAPKVVLEPDDIPERGDMVGRSRLEVVDPAAAERLAATPDPQLASLLPPAPSVIRPEDWDRRLWFTVVTSIATGGANQQAEHLTAFQAYAAAAQEGSIAKAHTATTPDAVRAASADWLYWKHLAGLIDSAMAAAS